MIDKETAIVLQAHAIEAIEALHNGLVSVIDRCSDEEFNKIRYGVGSSIATINTDLLDIIYQQYPELNHIRPNE